MFIGIVLGSKAQDFNIDETIEYINEKLNNNLPVIEIYAKYEWSVTKYGKLIIKHYWYEDLSSTQSMYLKQLDSSSIGISEYSWIYITCKENKNCVHGNSEGVSFNWKAYCFPYNNKEGTKKQLANAITHLIKLAHKKPEYKERDPFDY